MTAIMGQSRTSEGRPRLSGDGLRPFAEKLWWWTSGRVVKNQRRHPRKNVALALIAWA